MNTAWGHLSTPCTSNFKLTYYPPSGLCGRGAKSCAFSPYYFSSSWGWPVPLTRGGIWATWKLPQSLTVGSMMRCGQRSMPLIKQHPAYPLWIKGLEGLPDSDKVQAAFVHAATWADDIKTMLSCNALCRSQRLSS